jgi:hypothetical protein
MIESTRIEVPPLDVFQAEFYRWIEHMQSRPGPEPTTVLAIQHLERWADALGHGANFDRARPILAGWISAHFGQPRGA